MKKLNNTILNKINKELSKFYKDKIILDKTALNEGAPNSRVYKFKIGANPEIKLVKILDSNFSKKDTYEVEKNAMEKCSVSNIIKFEYTGIIDGFPFFTFPFINGAPLDKIINTHKFTEEEVVNFIYNLIDKIVALNACGIVHQDIKPANIIYTSSDITLLDLGIALLTKTHPKIKKGQGPLHYLSPEMSALCIKKNINNQHKIGYANDLYSLGLIALEMITRKRINKNIALDKMHEIKSYIEQNIKTSEETKQLLSALLEQSPTDRLIGVEKIKGGLVNSLKKDTNDIFWTQDVHNDRLNTYNKEGLFKTIDIKKFGVVLCGDVIQNQNTQLEKIKNLKKNGLKVMIDPRTMRLENSTIGYLKERSYVSKACDLIKEVISFEKFFNPDFFISPYYYVRDENDANFLSCLECYEKFINTDKHINKKNTFFGIALKESLLKNPHELSKIIDILNFNNSIENIYVLFETKMTSSHPNKDLEVLKGIDSFINKLSFRKKIFWGQADITAFYFTGRGLYNFSICPSYSFRKHDFDKYDKEQGGGGAPIQKIFSPQLFNEILVDAELLKPTPNGIPYKNELKYSGVFYNKNIKNDQNSKCHFLEYAYKYKQKISSYSEDDIKTLFNKNLDSAEKMYTIISNKYKIIFKEETNNSFIKIWKSILIN